MQISINKRRFSWVVFFICVFEWLLWSLPAISAASQEGSKLDRNIEQLVTRTYISREKDNLASSEDGWRSIDFQNNLKKLKGEDTEKLLAVQQQNQDSEALSNGKETSKQPSKWNYLTWTVMTFLTFMLGFREKRIPKLGEVSPDDSDEDLKSIKKQQKKREESENSSLEKSYQSEDFGLPISESRLQDDRFDAHLDSIQGSDRTNVTESLGATEEPDAKDLEILDLLESGKIAAHSLEDYLKDSSRAVAIRRQLLVRKLNRKVNINPIPFKDYNYDLVKGKCCENVIGYLPIPVGIVGPLIVNGQEYQVPMATTEGALIASTGRGCKAVNLSGGVSAVVVDNGMTRGPCVRMPNCSRAATLKSWIEDPNNYKLVESAFNSTSRFARLKSIKTTLAGRNVYMRFKAITGDAMGMNMISKGVEKSLDVLTNFFHDLELLCISGNYCTDKKPSAINWIDGRGRSVVADSIVKGSVVRDVLKTTVSSIVEVNTAKNLVGSAMAGSIGGMNAHAANILTAIYLATGQDPAQNVESSNCITLLEPRNNGEDLYISVSMPSIEVGTVGGGTSLPCQNACLELLNCSGSSSLEPGSNADNLAKLIASTVLAGELSLLAAIAAGHLVSAHLRMNRAKL
eukprot:TRINITY_DN14821_c0_g1_i1.p1 TRINITY_DN14821_c0_g1~~TRINITY_DN14821_c0_g1_i1.p1  ORF type:complete len:665 (+),score=143.26 TRINITY_DN14821_c0_g1_i1:107-1996(+)